jgi:polyisoprenyl-phosphate glycosyltransferase
MPFSSRTDSIPLSPINDNSSKPSIIILIPIFNDWKAFVSLLSCLDKVLYNHAVQAEILVVDDASTIPFAADLMPSQLSAIQRVSTLELKRNLGHQRAIAIGLAYIAANLPCKAVVVMDGDGEDDPADVPRLIDRCQAEDFTKVIFARRTKRSETMTFRSFYLLYKLVHKILTGYGIRVGNFSIIPHSYLDRIVVISEIWNHYAAGLLKAKIPFSEIATQRSTRLVGRSKMNFVSLVTHGISSISVYADVVGIRLLIALSIIISLITLLILAILLIKVFTDLAIPGWTSYMIGILCSIFLQSIMLAIVFALMNLNARNSYGFLLGQNYHYFVWSVKEIFSKL